MMELWIGVDESGDLGFSGRSSMYLVLAYVFTTDIHNIRKTLRRLLRRIVRKGIWPRTLNELKFTLSKARLRRQGIDPEKYIRYLDDVRLLVLDKMRTMNIHAAVSIVEKNRAREHLREEPDKLYNYALVHPLITRFIPKYNPAPGSRINIVLDKRLGSRAMASFRDYVKNKYNYMREHAGRISYDARFNVEQVSSHTEPLIWIADYIAGSVNHYMAKGDAEFLEHIREKIFDCRYFWENPIVCRNIIGV